MIPHISLVAYFNRKANGIDTFANLQQRGISQVLLLSGIPLGVDMTRSRLGDYYSPKMEEMVKQFALEISHDFKEISLTCYSENHPATKQLAFPYARWKDLQRPEVENFQQKAAWVLEGAKRDDCEFVSSAVMQHCYDTKAPIAIAQRLRQAMGDYLKIIPSILPPYESELVAGFCRHGFANLPPEVLAIAQEVSGAKTQDEKEEAWGKADQYTAVLAKEFAKNFSEIAFYPGKKISSAMHLAAVVENLCKLGVLQPDVPATVTESHQVQKIIAQESSISHC